MKAGEGHAFSVQEREGKSRCKKKNQETGGSHEAIQPRFRKRGGNTR